MSEPGKICKHCGKFKLLEEYGTHRETRDKRQVWCKQCVRDAVREWRSNPDNRRREREKARAARKLKKSSGKLL